jgi:hypothetical protein
MDYSSLKEKNILLITIKWSKTIQFGETFDNSYSGYLAFNEIETFGSFSGLLMNKNKTGGIWVGKLKHSKAFNFFSIFVWHDTCTNNKSKYR